MTVQNTVNNRVIIPGANQLGLYLPFIRDKRVAMVVNHTSMIANTHIVDSLLALNIDIGTIFSPEHGFKGTAYNGEEVKDGLYKGNIPIRSLYGKSRIPSKADLSEIDVIIFDIQDVGARFYTFISTLHYIMEAAATYGQQVIILDRPNPNGHYIDGPVLEKGFESFVGMHHVPIVYGMTIGEYGQMINGEGWLKEKKRCSLLVIPVADYDHHTSYPLPIPPSPNLPNYRSVLLYPSMCLLEGTVINEGRGTNKQFQVYGHPIMSKRNFSYTPISMTSSKYPKHEGKECGGIDLTFLSPDEIFSWGQINLQYVIETYATVGDKGEKPYFMENGWFNKLAGTKKLMSQIKNGLSEKEIRKSWQDDIEKFKAIRSKYLLYP